MERVEIDAPGPVVASRSARRAWLPAAHATWVLLALIAVALYVVGMQQRLLDLRQQYWGGQQIWTTQAPGGMVRLSVPRLGVLVRAGVLEGDELLAIDDVPVVSAADATARMEQPADRPVKLAVRTGNHRTRTYTILPLGPAGLALQDIGIPSQSVVGVVLLFDLLFGLFCLGVAGLIFLKRPRDWLALLVSATIVAALLGTSMAVVWAGMARPEFRRALDAWYSLGVVLLLLFFYLFPDGQFRPRWTRPVALVVALSFLPPLLNYHWYPWYLAPALQVPLLIVLLGTGAAALIYRYRFVASAEHRQQIRWVVLGATAGGAGVLLQAFPITAGMQLQGGTRAVYDLVLFPVGQVLRALLPISIAVAILRYHLWDITLVVNRTLVYAGLTFSVIVLYVAIVGAIGSLLQTTNNVAASLVATGVVALAFQPLRTRLQTAVNRLMYGERDNPYAVLGRLGKRLEGTLAPEAVLPTLVETVGQALKLPYVAIVNHRITGVGVTDGTANGAVEAAYGHPAPEVADLPLHYQGETVGHLIAASRQPGESLNQADLKLLSTIASQAGAAVHAVRLNTELQRSRQHLVTAREEERRRIRRDLHDGLGPALAAMAMEADAARDAVTSQPDEATALLQDITSKAQSALLDIRRLVYDLRPPALDELGLGGALRQHASAYSGTLRVEVRAPEPLGGLPAAVEVAAYRIAVEALNNAAQHARASRCTITITHTGESDRARSAALVLEVEDNGTGLQAGHHTGMGLISMRERAAELGGSCTIESKGHGTKVTARLPLPGQREEA